MVLWPRGREEVVGLLLGVEGRHDEVGRHRGQVVACRCSARKDERDSARGLSAPMGARESKLAFGTCREAVAGNR